MKTIIRRNPRQWRGVVLTGVALLLAVAVVTVLALAWRRGGPQPVREITVALTDAPATTELPAARPAR